MKRAALITTLVGLAVLASTWQAIATTRGWPAMLPRHLAWYLAAGVSWLLAVATVQPRTRAQLALVVLVAVAMRVPAWLAPPAHSDDVYRYLWDGRVQRNGVNPYLYAPEDAHLAALRDASWERINHRELPTLYPPLAQLAFAATPSLAMWKALLALADAAVALILYMAAPGGRRWVAWLWSPLVVIEIGLNGHVEVLGIALLAAGLLAWSRGRLVGAGAWVGAAMAVKLLPVVALAGMRRRRTFVAAFFMAGMLAVPYMGAGLRMTGSLGEYGRRWRANDGLFAVLQRSAEWGVARTVGTRPLTPPFHVGRFLSGRDRDELYPDETAGILARSAAGFLFIGAVAWAVQRAASTRQVVEVAIGAFMLLTPALHPWYVLWLLPMFVLGGSWAWLVLAALVPLGYRPLAEWQGRGTWHDPVWTRAVEHGATFAALAIDRWWTSGIILKLGESSPRRW